jgi:hypothetical protein
LVIRSTGPARAALLLSVIAGVAALATGCGDRRASIKPPDYSVLTVEKAFAAERLPLSFVSRSDGVAELDYRGLAELGPNTSNLDVEVRVRVWPRGHASGPLWIVFSPLHRVIRSRNVIVDFAPKRLGDVRAAIARLGRS